MASSITLLLPKLKARLRLGSGASVPTDPELRGFLLQAAKRAFAELPPIYQTEALVLDDLTATVADLRQPLYVQSERELLVPHEWTRMPGGVRVRSYRVAVPGENLLVWHTSEITLNDEDPFESSCALGDDWLEDYILELAGKTTMGNLINLSGSASGDLHGQTYRVSQDETEAIHRRLSGERARFELVFREGMADRVMARPPLRQSPLSGFRNRSRRLNRAAE